MRRNGVRLDLPIPLKPTPDARGFRLYWSGWLQAPNRLAIYGWWYVHRAVDNMVYLATTLGFVGPQNLSQEIDLTRSPGWPLLLPNAPEEDKTHVQQRARTRLRAFLEALP